MTPPRVIDDLLLDACVGCGCRDDHACADGCSWTIAYLLCSACAEDLPAAITGWAERAADAIARLTAWRRDLGAGDVAGLENTLRESILALAFLDPDQKGAPHPETTAAGPSEWDNDGGAGTNTTDPPARAAGTLPRPA
jgi:hypothetical protein